MGYGKRFGDFCAAFDAFSVFMYMFCQYMAMDFDEIEGIVAKLKYFISNEPRKEYRYFLTLFILFVLSFVVSTVFHRLPFLTLAVSVLPMIQIIVMFDGEKLYERPMLFIVLSALHIVGCLFECIRRDRDDRGRRAALAVDLLGLVAAGFCGYILYLSKDIADVDFTHISIIERTLYSAVVHFEADLSIFKYLAIGLCVAVVLRLVLRDLYYLDALLSLVPLGICIYKWNSGSISVFGSVLVMLTFVYAIGRISVMIFCKPKCIDEKV